MIFSIPFDELKDYVFRQLNHFFPDNISLDNEHYNLAFDRAVMRIEYCFQHIKLESYNKNGNTYLNHLHSDQYAMLLWFLSNSVWEETGNNQYASKLFCLNKALHGLNCMYDTKLPKIFILLHTVGTILGKAHYSDYLAVAQGCTVGAQHSLYPVLGERVSLLPNSSVIGNCKVGNRVSFGINSLTYNKDIESDTIVFVGSDGNHNYKKSDTIWSDNVFL